MQTQNSKLKTQKGKGKNRSARSALFLSFEFCLLS